jgi:hypothetical protein
MRPNNLIRRPIFDRNKQGDVSYLMSHVVKVLEYANMVSVPLTHLQMSNLVFNESDSNLLRRVYQEFRAYFIQTGSKKRLDYNKLRLEHPAIWDPTLRVDSALNFNKDEILKALRNEYGNVKEHRNTSHLRITNITEIEERKKLYIYRGQLGDHSDDPIRFNEGDRLIIKSNNARHYATALFHEPLKSTLAFQVTSKIDFKVGSIEIGGVPTVGKLIEIIDGLIVNPELPIWKLMSNQNHCVQIANLPQPFVHRLDESQELAVKQALKNDITFIWGPPGTGKSHTLARLIVNLYEQGERTAVTSISNVAVDSLLSKFIALADGDYRDKTRTDLLQQNEILRLGYSQSDHIRNIKQIQFDNAEINRLTAALEQLNNTIDELGESDRALALRSERDEIKRKLDHETRLFINKSKVVFLTSSKFLLDSSLRDAEVDNLIVDEGSMMNIPMLLALTQKVKKRIIVCGDFMQLGPISLAQNQEAKKWLHTDLFKLIGLGPDQSPERNSLVMLNTQRRMVLNIAEIVNKSFYKGQLITASNVQHYKYKDLINQGHVEFIEMGTSNPEYKSEFSRSRSRYNKFNRLRVLELLTEILTLHPGANIGIITPYAQQVADYKIDLEQKQWESVLVGTIHSFQGSECDIIIWDMVDTINDSIGKLYKGETGERLVNVAISRAISKLIVVGNHRVFNEAQGYNDVTSRLKRVASFCWEEAKFQ